MHRNGIHVQIKPRLYNSLIYRLVHKTNFCLDKGQVWPKIETQSGKIMFKYIPFEILIEIINLF